MQKIDNRKCNLAKFIKKAKLKYGNLYNYDKVIYKGSAYRIIINCTIHGDFERRANTFLSNGGCEKCKRAYNGNTKRILNTNIDIPKGAIAVPLPKGKYTIVDEEDYQRVSSKFWYSTPRNYVRSTDTRNYIFLHRFILNLTDPNIFVDHINRNPLDNRKKNLRECTTQQNSCNQPPRGRSAFKGVSWASANSKWRASIGYNNKVKYIGYYPTEEEAARAYDIKARELHGDFANLNFKE